MWGGAASRKKITTKKSSIMEGGRGRPKLDRVEGG